jgi:hypothetical protein
MERAIDGEWGYPHTLSGTKKHYMINRNESLCGYIPRGTGYVAIPLSGTNVCKFCLKNYRRLKRIMIEFIDSWGYPKGADILRSKLHYFIKDNSFCGKYNRGIRSIAQFQIKKMIAAKNVMPSGVMPSGKMIQRLKSKNKTLA